MTPAIPLQSSGEAACLTSGQEYPEFHCKLLTTLFELETFADDWRRLWKLDPQREIFQHFGWITCWIRAYKYDGRLCVLAVFDGNGVAGFLPLVFENRVVRFAGYSVSDYNGLICDPARACRVLEAAIQALLRTDGWDRIVLENVPARSSLAACLESLSPGARRHMEVIRGIPCPTLVLSEQKEQILDGILAKSKRKVNALRRLGNVRFRHIEDPAELKAHLPAFYRQHINRWAVDGIRSRFVENASIEFYESLLARLHIRDEIRFSVLELDERPVAYLLGFQVNGKYSFYKPTFDIDLWDHSPGLVLLFNLFRHVKTEDVSEFDFGLGGESYKYRFSNLTRQNLDIHIHRPGVRGAAIRFGLRLKERVRTQRLVAPVWHKWTESWRRFLAGLNWNSIRSIFPVWESVWILSPPETSADVENRLSSNAAKLSELAGLSREYPGHFDRVRLRRARVRMQQGEIPYLISSRGRLRWLAWLRGNESNDGAAIYDLWSPPGAPPDEALPGLPEILTRLAAGQGLKNWQLHLRPETAPPPLFRKAGFRFSRRVLRVRLFHSLSLTFLFRADAETEKLSRH